MAAAPPSLSAELAAALRRDAAGAAAAAGAAERLRDLRGGTALVEAVMAGPAGPGERTWGARFREALAFAAEQPALFVALESLGGYWHLLDLASDAKGLPPPERKAHAAQFDDRPLLEALVRALASGSPAQLPALRCARNLARSAELRAQLLGAVPALVGGLSLDPADPAIAQGSAAALCNVACHSAGKKAAVEAGGVAKLVALLRQPGLAADVAEDLVACLGVLTGGSEEGLGALLGVAATEGETETFGPLIELLRREDAPALQCVVLDVLGGVAGPCPQFRDWLVRESAMATEVLPQLLRAEAEDVRKAALEFAGLLVEVGGFRDAFQRGGGVGALQSVLERAAAFGAAAGAAFMAPLPGAPQGGRRGPSERELAQFLMSKILLI